VPGLDGKAAAPPTDFVKVIQAFDSHERGILFQWSAGSPFVLSAQLRQRLGDAVQVDVPGDAYVAMDYTLDWLHAAITCYLDPNAWDEPQPLGDGTIAGSQEDVDLLVAWEEKGPHLLLIEASKRIHRLVEQADAEQGGSPEGDYHAKGPGGDRRALRPGRAKPVKGAPDRVLAGVDAQAGPNPLCEAHRPGTSLECAALRART